MPPIPTITDIAFQLRAIRVPNSTPTPAPTTATSVSTASELGIDRFFFVASTIFAVAYLFLTGWFTYQFFKKRIYHFGIVVSICGYRLGMFIFQAVLAHNGSDSASDRIKDIITLVTIDEGFSIGFITLLYFASGMVVARPRPVHQHRQSIRTATARTPTPATTPITTTTSTENVPSTLFSQILGMVQDMLSVQY